MRFLAASLSLLLAVPAAAQNCLDGDFGTLLATSPTDVLLPIEPIGFAFPLGGTTYTDVHISDHGFVQLSNAGVPAPVGGAVLFTPTTANLVAGSAKVCALYADIVGTGGGEIYINSSPTRCLITWFNHQNYANGGVATLRFSFQLALFPNGDFRVVFGPGVTNQSTFGVPSDNGICGASPGNAAALPAQVDLSTAGASTDNTTFELWTVPNSFDLANNTILFLATNPGYSWAPLGASANCGTTSTYGTGCDGLVLSPSGQPTLGASSFALRVSSIPAVSPIALVGFGTQVVNPGLDLTFVGMAGCFGYTDLGIGLFTSGPVVSGVSEFSLAIPNNPALVGAVLSSQGVSLSATTSLGLAASNGMQITVGQGF
jgi:hypothetical protein